MSAAKRQKLSKSNASIAQVPVTVYDAPHESLINFPSSIVNGVTKENGLVSLTLKSVTCAKLVEDHTWMHGALFNSPENPVRITDKPIDPASMLASLKEEVSQLKEKKYNTTDVSDTIDQWSKRLDQSILNTQGLELLKNDFLNSHEKENPNTYLSFSNAQYTTVPKNKGITFPITVESIEDVKQSTDKDIKESVDEDIKESVNEDVKEVVQETVENKEIPANDAAA